MAGSIIVIVVALAIYGAAMYYKVWERKKLLESGNIVNRDKNFWDYAESFSVSNVTLEAILNRLNTELSSRKVGAARITPELQKQNNRILINGTDGLHESFVATIDMVSSEEDINTYKMTVHSMKYRNGRPDEQLYNIFYTAVEKTFLAFDPNVKVKTEFVDRKTKRSFL